jgi:hypothetical protein
MSLRSWGRSGGWTAIGAAVTLVGILVTWTQYQAEDQKELLRRVGALERSSDWQEIVLYSLAQKARVAVPPRPAREPRPDPDMPTDGLFAADTNRTSGGCSP